MRHAVPRISVPPVVDADWHSSLWSGLEALSLNNFLGMDPPAHRPRTQVKVAYRPDALYWIFRVEDRYVRAVAERHQDPVCRDSCVEFFFVPGSDIAQGYFNIEINCGGAVLFHWQPVPKRDAVVVAEADVAALSVAASLPKTVDPEIVEPTVWTVACRLPVAVLQRYAPVAAPAPGVVWRANFYKCGDATSHPHWLTWSPVDPSPFGFHRPDVFGELVFQ